MKLAELRATALKLGAAVLGETASAADASDELRRIREGLLKKFPVLRDPVASPARARGQLQLPPRRAQQQPLALAPHMRRGELPAPRKYWAPRDAPEKTNLALHGPAGPIYAEFRSPAAALQHPAQAAVRLPRAAVLFWGHTGYTVALVSVPSGGAEERFELALAVCPESAAPGGGLAAPGVAAVGAAVDGGGGGGAQDGYVKRIAFSVGDGPEQTLPVASDDASLDVFVETGRLLVSNGNTVVAIDVPPRLGHDNEGPDKLTCTLVWRAPFGRPNSAVDAPRVVDARWSAHSDEHALVLAELEVGALDELELEREHEHEHSRALAETRSFLLLVGAPMFVGDAAAASAAAAFAAPAAAAAAAPAAAVAAEEEEADGVGEGSVGAHSAGAAPEPPVLLRIPFPRGRLASALCPFPAHAGGWAGLSVAALCTTGELFVACPVAAPGALLPRGTLDALREAEDRAYDCGAAAAREVPRGCVSGSGLRRAWLRDCLEDAGGDRVRVRARPRGELFGPRRHGARMFAVGDAAVLDGRFKGLVCEVHDPPERTVSLLLGDGRCINRVAEKRLSPLGGRWRVCLQRVRPVAEPVLREEDCAPWVDVLARAAAQPAGAVVTALDGRGRLLTLLANAPLAPAWTRQFERPGGHDALAALPGVAMPPADALEQRLDAKLMEREDCVRWLVVGATALPPLAGAPLQRLRIVFDELAGAAASSADVLFVAGAGAAAEVVQHWRASLPEPGPAAARRLAMPTVCLSKFGVEAQAVCWAPGAGGLGALRLVRRVGRRVGALDVPFAQVEGEAGGAIYCKFMPVAVIGGDDAGGAAEPGADADAGANDAAAKANAEEGDYVRKIENCVFFVPKSAGAGEGGAIAKAREWRRTNAAEMQRMNAAMRVLLGSTVLALETLKPVDAPADKAAEAAVKAGAKAAAESLAAWLGSDAPAATELEALRLELRKAADEDRRPPSGAAPPTDDARKKKESEHNGKMLLLVRCLRAAQFSLRKFVTLRTCEAAALKAELEKVWADAREARRQPGAGAGALPQLARQDELLLRAETVFRLFGALDAAGCSHGARAHDIQDGDVGEGLRRQVRRDLQSLRLAAGPAPGAAAPAPGVGAAPAADNDPAAEKLFDAYLSLSRRFAGRASQAEIDAKNQLDALSRQLPQAPLQHMDLAALEQAAAAAKAAGEVEAKIEADAAAKSEAEAAAEASPAAANRSRSRSMGRRKLPTVSISRAGSEYAHMHAHAHAHTHAHEHAPEPEHEHKHEPNFDLDLDLEFDPARFEEIFGPKLLVKVAEEHSPPVQHETAAALDGAAFVVVYFAAGGHAQRPFEEALEAWAALAGERPGVPPHCVVFASLRVGDDYDYEEAFHGSGAHVRLALDFVENDPNGHAASAKKLAGYFVQEVGDIAAPMLVVLDATGHRTNANMSIAALEETLQSDDPTALFRRSFRTA